MWHYRSASGRLTDWWGVHGGEWGAEPYIALSTTEGVVVYKVEHYHDVYRFQQSTASCKQVGVIDGSQESFDAMHITRMAALDETDREGFVVFAHRMGSASVTAWKVVCAQSRASASRMG